MTIEISELKALLKSVLAELKSSGSAEELLTVEELAGRLKCPISWVYSRSRETSDNAIPRITCGKYLRFEWSAVRSWLDNQSK